MGIKLSEDVGAPITVIAVDMITAEVAPNWNEWVAYIMTALGYVGAGMGFGGNYVKNLGVASLPLTARNIRDRVRGGVGRKVAGGRLAFRPTANPGSIRQTTVPEFEDVRVS